MKMSTIAICVLAMMAGSSPRALASTAVAPSYKMTKAIPLGDGERWDYVTFDPASGRAYVAHGDHVTVVDTRSGAVVGQIASFPGGTHGIGIATAAGHG